MRCVCCSLLVCSAEQAVIAILHSCRKRINNCERCLYIALNCCLYGRLKDKVYYFLSVIEIEKGLLLIVHCLFDLLCNYRIVRLDIQCIARVHGVIAAAKIMPCIIPFRGNIIKFEVRTCRFRKGFAVKIILVIEREVVRLFAFLITVEVCCLYNRVCFVCDGGV